MAKAKTVPTCRAAVFVQRGTSPIRKAAMAGPVSTAEAARAAIQCSAWVPAGRGTPSAPPPTITAPPRAGSTTPAAARKPKRWRTRSNRWGAVCCRRIQDAAPPTTTSSARVKSAVVDTASAVSTPPLACTAWAPWAMNAPTA
jgi:hypothetical protein